MPRNTMEAWLLDEQGSDVIKRIEYYSVAESNLRAIPMAGATKTEPRMADMSVAVVAKGAAYSEDTAANDEVILTAIKFGTALRIAEEDVNDQLAGLIEAKKLSWAAQFGILLDNAVLSVTAAANGGTVPFTSIYRSLSTANAATAYTANANKITTGGGAAATRYGKLSALMALVEGSGYSGGRSDVFIAHPGLQGFIREIVDSTGAPIFNQSPRQGDPDTLWGHPILWSNGSVVTATASAAQSLVVGGGAAGAVGNGLIFYGNPDYAFVGKRSGVESVLIDGRDGLSALTDETILKVRARRAFVLAHEKAWAVLEVTNV